MLVDEKLYSKYDCGENAALFERIGEIITRPYMIPNFGIHAVEYLPVQIPRSWAKRQPLHRKYLTAPPLEDQNSADRPRATC